MSHRLQTSQLSRFGRETHDFLTDLTTACQSHDLAEILLLLCASYHTNIT